MSETSVEIEYDWNAIALQIIRSLLGRRLTYPYMRAVDAYPPARELHLTGRPVREIYSVSIHRPVGSPTVLSPDQYEVSSNFRLKIASSVPLPYVSYENGRCTSEIRVDYEYGAKPPPAVQRAIDLYAEQLDLASQGEDCKLPKRVTSIVSQGLSMTLLDPQDYLEKGMTGVPEVDQVIAALNPGKAKAPSRLFTAKNPPARRLSVVQSGGGSNVYDLRIVKAARYRRGFRYTINGVDQDLSAYTWRAQIRQTEDDEAPLILDLTPYITLEEDDRTLRLDLSSSATEALMLSGLRPSWDLFLWPTAQPESSFMLVEGRVFANQNVTEV